MRQHLIFALVLVAPLSVCGCRQFVPIVERGFDRVEEFANGQPPQTYAAQQAGSNSSLQGDHHTMHTAAIRSANPFADADPFLADTTSSTNATGNAVPDGTPSGSLAGPGAELGELTVLSVPASHLTARPSRDSAGRATLNPDPSASEAGWRPTRHAN